MKRLLWITLLLILTLLYVSMACTGVPLFMRALPLRAKLPPGNVSSGEPLSPEATAAATLLVQSRESRVHRLQGHGIGVALWLLAPLAAVLPLFPAWRNIRRRKTAASATLILLLAAVVLILLESFTGYFIGVMLRRTDDVVQGTFMRFAALHALGFPLLMVIVLAFLLGVQARLSRRAARG